MDQNRTFKEAIDQLLQILDRLLGLEGCPWTRQQTLSSLKQYAIEEAYELAEAIEVDDTSKIIEELGDFFFNALFLCKVGEKEGRFAAQEVVDEVREKMIRRNKHVFLGPRLHSVQAVLDEWKRIKKQEKIEKRQDSITDGIPLHFPSLSRAFEIVHRIKTTNYQDKVAPTEFNIKTEEDLGAFLFQIAAQAEQLQIDPETALRKIVSQYEGEFRNWEEDAKKTGDSLKA